MHARTPEELKQPFNLDNQTEIYFTMKVFATTEGTTIKTLKYSIDFHPPFEPNTTSTVEPYASPLRNGNMKVFDKIFKNIMQVFTFISAPTEYPLPATYKNKKTPKWRDDEQQRLAQAITLADKAINHVTYEMNSPPSLSVGALFRTTGNGDMRPPRGS